MVRTRRAEGADRDRPRPPRLRLGRQPQPRDRGDARRLRRGLRLAAAQRAAQHGERRHLGVAASRRRRRHGLLAARRRRDRLRRHATRPRGASSACCGTIRRPASCATPTPATTRRSPAPASRGSTCRCWRRDRRRTWTLLPGRLTLDQIARCCTPAACALHLAARPARTRYAPARRWCSAWPPASAPVYGVNTGFGKLADKRIADGELEPLQRNLIRSHSAGVGEPLRARRGAPDAGAEGRQPGARLLGRARGGGRRAARARTTRASCRTSRRRARSAPPATWRRWRT